MKKFRSVLALLLALALIFSFAGCGSKDSGSSDEAAPSEQDAHQQRNAGISDEGFGVGCAFGCPPSSALAYVPRA